MGHDIIVRIVHKVLWNRTRDIHLIEDFCQNILVICWKNAGSLRDLPSERLERFVVRVALNQYHSWRRKRRPLEWREGFEEESRDEDPALATEKAEQSVCLVSLIEGLPPRYREIVRLHIMEGWTYDQIASSRGIPVNTAKTHFHRAKGLLEEAVKRHFAN